MHNTKREPGCKLWSCGDNVPTPVQDISSVEAVQADIYGKSLQFSLSFAVNLKLLLGFLDSSVGKESACSAGDPGLIAGLGRSPGEGNGNQLRYSVFLPGESHGQRSLRGYSPWDHNFSLLYKRVC